MWINTSTNAVLLTHSDIRINAGNVSFPAIMTDEMIADFGYMPVTMVPPTYDPLTQTATETAPIQVNGVWTQQWSITDMSAQDIELKRKSMVPGSVTPRQIRQALTASSLRDTVENAVAASDQNIKDWYNHSTMFDRYNTHTLAMATSLNITDLQLDNLWTLAGTL